MRSNPIKPYSRSLAALSLAAALVCGAVKTAAAHPNQAGDASAASALSLALPVAVSVAAPVGLLSAGAALTVVSVQATASGTVWLLERASDGTRASVHFSGRAAEATLAGTGSALLVTAISTGWVLSAAGEVIAFVPNELGRALLNSEQLTR